MSVEYEPSSGDHVFRAAGAISEDATRRVGLLVGDVVHNLRSALDHLFWQLALVYCRGNMRWDEREQRRIQFPIVDTSGQFEGNRARKFVYPEHWTIIEKHQPYGGRFGEALASLHPLGRLRELSNTDKHRVITPVTVLSNKHTDLAEFFRGFGGEITDMVPLGSGAYHSVMSQDTEVVRVKVRPASLQLNMDVAGYVVPNPSVIDRFPKGPARIVPLDGALHEIILEVRGVVRAFHELSY